jgi:uncharacterized membrane protein
MGCKYYCCAQLRTVPLPHTGVTSPARREHRFYIYLRRQEQQKKKINSGNRNAQKLSEKNHEDMIQNNRGFASAASGKPDSPETASILPAFAMLILAAVVNIMVLVRIDLPVVRPVLGFWFLIILPSYLLFTTSVWRKCGLQERLGYSVCSVLLILMLTGLVINEFLPLLGVQRPLDAGSIVILGDLINLSLYFFRSRNLDGIRLRAAFGPVSKEEFRLLVAATLAVVLAIFGANHLNNGASANITLIALAMTALVGVFSVRWLRFTRESVMSVVIYLVSLSLLLTTSLRGWYVTGHDIQQEYLVFQLTEAHAHWSMAYFNDPYSACLSITILPTELGQVINVDSPYVYKLFFQLIFALCPVLAYSIARRYFNRGISTLSVAYFVSFPTFFTDMPFLNRQEIALLFVAVGLLAATNPVWSIRRRQVFLGISGLGTEISHYSTMYVLVGTLVIALLLSNVSHPFFKFDSSGDREDSATLDVHHGGRRWTPTARGVVSLGVVAVFIGIVFAWGTLATRTTSQVLNAGQDALSFSILPGSSNSQGSMLNNLRQEGLQARASAAPGTYLPWSAVSKAATPIVQQPLIPLTAIGRNLNSIGIPVAALNSFAPNLEIYGDGLFVVIGLVSLFVEGRRRGRIFGEQFFWLAAGCTVMIVLIEALPSISADYGALRAFQQGLLFFAPIIVTGSMAIFKPIGQHRMRIAGCVICLGGFLATSALVPQILGNSSAELNLDNSGLYYDLDYKTPQDAAAGTWLDVQPDVLHYPIQASWDARRFFLTGPSVISGSEAILDEYPTLVYQNSWVILDHSVTGSGRACSFDSTTGVITEYKYPTELLHDYKNLVYTDGGALIYK